jgi:hypothetical protein
MFKDMTKLAKIDIMQIAGRGGLDWSKVPDDDFPAEVRGAPNAVEEIARLRRELAQPVPALYSKVGKNNPPNMTPAQTAYRQALKEFFASRMIMRVDRARNDSSLPPEWNPIEPRINGLRLEFPSGQWVGAPVNQVDGLQDAHGHLFAQCKNRKPPDDLPPGSDLAFEGMEIFYFELKRFTITIHIPASVYSKKAKAA